MADPLGIVGKDPLGIAPEDPLSIYNTPALPFSAKHPNIYGLYGAGKETVQQVVPFMQLMDKEERAQVVENVRQKQVERGADRGALLGQLYIEELTPDILFAGLMGMGAEIKAVSSVVKSAFKAKFPKTYKFLTTPIGKSQKTVAQKIKGYKDKHGEHPPPEVIDDWWMMAAEKTKPAGATKVEAMYARAETAGTRAGKKTPKMVYEKAKRKFVDVSGNIKKELLKQGDEGKKAVMRHDLIAGAAAKSTIELDDAAKVIYEGLSKEEVKTLNRIISSRRTIAIENYKKIKHPEGLGAVEHSEYLASLPPNTATKLGARADEYFNVMRTQLDKLRGEGLIGDKQYEALVKGGEYSKRKFLQHIDPEKTYNFSGKKITVRDSGIRRLEEGSEGLLEMDSRLLMNEVVTATDARIARNRANRALYDFVEANPDNKIASIAKVARKTKEGKIVYQDPPTGHEKISVLIDGKPKELILPDALAEEWVMRNPEISHELATLLGWVSGSKILKPMATGLNPEFALSNLPRDIAHIWLTTQEYSSFAPKAAGQLARDVAAVAKDTVLKKGAWRDYIKEGGGMEFLTHQGQFKGVGGTFGKIQDALGWVGATSEALTRLALRQRALRSGKSAEEATWIARNYLDFSQGGSWAKAIDSSIPYFNAAIQGTRGVFRAAAQKPGVTSFKIAQIMGTAAGLYMANSIQNPEAWKQIPSREKVNNWIFTTPFSFKDKDGTKRYVYFKVAKDQAQRVLTSVSENLMARQMGEQVDVDQITQSVQEFMPIVPSENLPPTLDAVLGYAANKDFWRNEDIWRGPEIEPSEEHTRYTHPAFVELGKRTGLSPERTKYALGQYFTHGNIYTAVTGHAWNQIMGEVDDETKRLVEEEIILGHPFIRRVARKTDPYYEYGKQIDKDRIKARTESFKRGRELDTLAQRFYDKEIPRATIKGYIDSAPIEDRPRLWKRFTRLGQIQDLPNRRWWLSVSRMGNPEAKATAYWNKWRDSTPEEQRQMDKNLKRVPGIKSGRFYKRLKQLKVKNALRKEKEKEE